MSAVRPVAVYALKVPTGGVLIPAVPQAAASFRVSMAAIDPDETPELEDGIDPSKPRATLKLIRPPPGMNIEESDEEEDWEDDDEEDSDEEESNGGPSDKEKARKLKEAAALKEMEEDEDEDDDEEDDDDDDDDDEEEDFDLKAAISKLVKGKGPATDDDDDDDDDEDDESLDVDEAVICTLDPEKHYQQALDITVAEGEPIFFKVTGTHSVYLTGNYVMPVDDHDHDHDHSDEEDEDDYDLSPDENELDMDDIMDEDEEDDELDGLENPRVTEVESEEEAPKLVEAKGQKKADKGKKRAAEEASLEDLMAKDKKAQPEEGLSKKQQKKLKKNSGEAAEVEQKKEAKEAKEAKDAKEGKEAKEGKKVQFAKNLEQGPTPSSQDKKSETTGTLGVKNVNGVTIDDKKLGKGPVAKSGNNVAMRYIGKLEDGKVFDSNKKGKPFSFKLGKGEVIKGWDIGVAGMAVGAERRISIPPHLAYGKKALPGIPGNSKLVFDVKLLEIK